MNTYENDRDNLERLIAYLRGRRQANISDNRWIVNRRGAVVRGFATVSAAYPIGTKVPQRVRVENDVPNNRFFRNYMDVVKLIRHFFARFPTRSELSVLITSEFHCVAMFVSKHHGVYKLRAFDSTYSHGARRFVCRFIRLLTRTVRYLDTLVDDIHGNQTAQCTMFAIERMVDHWAFKWNPWTAPVAFVVDVFRIEIHSQNENWQQGRTGLHGLQEYNRVVRLSVNYGRNVGFRQSRRYPCPPLPDNLFMYSLSLP